MKDLKRLEKLAKRILMINLVMQIGVFVMFINLVINFTRWNFGVLVWLYVIQYIIAHLLNSNFNDEYTKSIKKIKENIRKGVK